ncbi:hypothetical protein H6P81_013737 [Aristolochia fimbriata]|uniref:Uncharacterized protein n=1 Tax=Aristolochia fimbriata TaxID=158543 RepID=A0AAV7EH62_ARIFI|nr:hypothetical protein H6P81_013737 [Aristolochia fimbriata]
MTVMELKIRARDYGAELAAATLPRVPAGSHPLANCPSSQQVKDVSREEVDFDDPLRATTRKVEDFSKNVEQVELATTRGIDHELNKVSSKEWAAFKRSLTQRFPVTQTISTTLTSDIVMRSDRAPEKSLASVHLDELDDPKKFAEKEARVLTKQEYLSQLNEFKEEIRRAWLAGDRVTSLRTSIKVARLLLDTSVLQFYPTLFVLVIDTMDMLGDLVWDRIKKKAEFSDDGSQICSLSGTFTSNDVCSEAKETCSNWFCKIGSIRELLPRIYLELAILHCYRFLQDNFFATIQRLTMMMRGIADPLAYIYCHLYMVSCVHKLPLPSTDFLIDSISDIETALKRIVLVKESSEENYEHRKMLFNLMEPTIEWIMKCVFRGCSQSKINDVSVKVGLGRNQLTMTENVPCISIILHHFIKQLPIEVVNTKAWEILQVIECCNDISLDQYFNFRLLGLKLSECRPTRNVADAIIGRIFQAGSQLDDIYKYLKVADAYLDLVLQYQMDQYLAIILGGIFVRIGSKRATEDESDSLQSIYGKILNHFCNLEDIFSLDYFIEILDTVHGVSRNTVNMRILKKATRNGYIQDPRMIQLLFEVARSLHDSIDYANMKNEDHQQPSHHICLFVSKVDFVADLEQHLTFLIECRAVFRNTNEIKETLVHSCNSLAVKAIRDEEKRLDFVRSCIAFNEVTIPSITNVIGRMNSYLETAEVALLGGLVPHTDELIESAIDTLRSLEMSDGAQLPSGVGGIFPLVRKLCSFLVIVPGNLDEGTTWAPRNIISTVNPVSCTIPEFRIKTFCAVLLLSAALAQDKLPYHSDNREIVGNDQLFFGEPSYFRELESISSVVLQNLIDGVQQESSPVVRGNLALEACNCVVSSFEASHETTRICAKLMEIAKSCLQSKHGYLQNTLRVTNKYIANVPVNVSAFSAPTIQRESISSSPLQ